MSDESKSNLSKDAQKRPKHPSRNLGPRSRGYGIGGGYERPYRKPLDSAEDVTQSYGPLPHSGYYGAGKTSKRFKHGQAGYNEELRWYGPQYGLNSSKPDDNDR